MTKIIKKLFRTNEKSLNSFAWDKQDEIPEGYYIYYNAAASFEVGIPDTWVLGTAENAITARDSNTGASLTISIQENPNYLDGVTATDMANLLKSGKSNFMLNDYQNSKTEASPTHIHITIFRTSLVLALVFVLLIVITGFK